MPIQLTWVREVGSTWRYHIAKSISEEDLIQENKFRNFVKYGYLSNEPLSVQFGYILKKLGKGQYTLEIEYLPEDLYPVEVSDSGNKYIYSDTYAGVEEVIETQSDFNEVIASTYEELIKSGAEPLVVILTSPGSKNKFILDGHHKLSAYLRLKKHPKALIITLLTKQPVSKEEGLAIMKMSRCQNQDYRNSFLEEY